jgi:DNA-binding transcriptional LysR family regulator
LQAVMPKNAAAAIRPSQLLALQAFHVAARTLSFKAAAASLNLTPSAVSHRIRNLEQSFGVPLFARSNRAIALNAEGKRLASATGRAFAELARASASPRPGRQTLKLKVQPMFASAWLIPRMADFLRHHPTVEVAIESAGCNVDFTAETFDAGISVGGNENEFEGLVAHHLTDIATTPVTSPVLAKRLRLRKPADLRRAVLIEVTTYPAAWRLWLDHAGEPGLKPKRTIAVDSFVAAMQAAEQGAGVALGLEPFAQSRERGGAICRPLPIALSTGAYWLVYPKGVRRSRPLEAFRRWLLAEVRKG